jgi:hypothetical protein
MPDVDDCPLSGNQHSDFDLPLRVGSALSADRVADVRLASRADRRREIVSDCFGEWARSSGPLAYGGCTLEPVVGGTNFWPTG